MWWGDVGSNARTSDTSLVGDVVGFDINPGTGKVYNWRSGEWEETANVSPHNAYIGWGVYVTNRVSDDELKRKCTWSAAAHLGGKDLSLWTSAYPSGFQPYRNSHFNYDEWEAAGYDRAFVEDYLSLERRQLQPPQRGQRAAHPGHLPVLLARRGRARQRSRQWRLGAQEIADDIYCRLGGDHRPDRPREPARAVPGLTRPVADHRGRGWTAPPARSPWGAWLPRTPFDSAAHPGAFATSIPNGYALEQRRPHPHRPPGRHHDTSQAHRADPHPRIVRACSCSWSRPSSSRRLASWTSASRTGSRRCSPGSSGASRCASARCSSAASRASDSCSFSRPRCSSSR